VKALRRAGCGGNCGQPVPDCGAPAPIEVKSPPTYVVGLPGRIAWTTALAWPHQASVFDTLGSIRAKLLQALPRCS